MIYKMKLKVIKTCAFLLVTEISVRFGFSSLEGSFFSLFMTSLFLYKFFQGKLAMNQIWGVDTNVFHVVLNEFHMDSLILHNRLYTLSSHKWDTIQHHDQRRLANACKLQVQNTVIANLELYHKGFEYPGIRICTIKVLMENG